MIKFFQKIRYDLMNQNKSAKYFKYALGEIILVVIGILIALQINNWNQGKINSKIEANLLIELLENLSVNEDRLAQSIKDEYISAKSIEYVVTSLENRYVHNDTMNYHFGRADFSADVVISSTAFETIKSKGFDIISSNTLRKSMIDLFDSEYGVLLSETVRLEDLYWPNASLPLFHKHFKIKHFKRNTQNSSYDAIPTNYKALLNDTIYINMVKHRGSFRYHGASLKENALEKTSILKQEITNYLDK